jgi:hypothetical protein
LRPRGLRQRVVGMAEPAPLSDWDQLLTCSPEALWGALSGVRHQDPARRRAWVRVCVLDLCEAD